MTKDTSHAPRSLDTKAVSPAKFAHFVLRTPQYEKMRAFYQTFLNATPAFNSDFLVFLRYDEEHHRLVLINMPHMPLQTGPGAGLEHVSFTYKTLGDLLGNYLRLKSEGIHPCWCINHGMTTSIYYDDPDGNQLETQYDNLDNDAADAFMRGEYFAKNPIGVDFDPELLIERYRRGDPLDELIRQGSALPPKDAKPLQPQMVPPYDARGERLKSLL